MHCLTNICQHTSTDTWVIVTLQHLIRLMLYMNKLTLGVTIKFLSCSLLKLLIVKLIGSLIKLTDLINWGNKHIEDIN